MERESNKDERGQHVEEREHEPASPEHGEFHPPFASEGLQLVRDSPC
ncbi:hypothetical protein [Bradyrhizobium sp. NAS80.1]|nr:hypothetical protein [Bradyrhizobium sp. NAS80.1]